LVQRSGPMHGQIVAEFSLKPVPIEGTATDGPAQVATTAYRSGWERIFGSQTVVGEA